MYLELLATLATTAYLVKTHYQVKFYRGGSINIKGTLEETINRPDNKHAEPIFKNKDEIAAVAKTRALLTPYAPFVEKPIAFGHQFKTAGGTIINIFTTTGKVSMQGKKDENLEKILTDNRIIIVK